MMTDTCGANILLIDDHPAVRQGLSILLAGRGYIVGAEAEGRTDALRLLQERLLDVALLDLTLQDGSGLDLLPELEAHDIAALIYTMHDEPDVVARAFRAGALGYVTKQEEPKVLFSGIEAVARGERYVSPVAAQSLEEYGEEEDPEDLLSDREKQVFILLGKGVGNIEIAEEFGISPRTVQTYYARMVKKLNLKNIGELRKHAVSAAGEL